MLPASLPEYWLRGPIPGVPDLLQPVAHALLQARDEVEQLLDGFPEILAWEQPAGMASVSFHLQHLVGVLDRLFTYARGAQLDKQQLSYLAAEGKKDVTVSIHSLFTHFKQQVDKAITELRTINISTLTETRGVGRKQIPSTVIGLFFHAAEHVMRHTGQLIVTVKVVKQNV